MSLQRLLNRRRPIFFTLGKRLPNSRDILPLWQYLANMLALIGLEVYYFSFTSPLPNTDLTTLRWLGRDHARLSCKLNLALGSANDPAEA